MNLSEFVHALAVAKGLDQDDPELKLILSHGDLTKIDVPKSLEDITGYKLKDMLTMEAAKQHPELKKHFVATVLGGLDKDIEKLASEYELTDEQRAELKKEANTYKRNETLLKLVKEKFEKKAPASDDEKNKKLSQEVKSLNDQILALNEERERERKDLAKGYTEKLRQRATKDLFQSYEYTDALPKQVQLQTAQALFDEILKKENYKVVFNEENDSLQLFTDQDTEVFRNNKPVTLKGFVETVLAENKLLKVTPAATQNTNQKKESTLVNIPGAGNGKMDTSSYLHAIAEAKESMAQS